MRSSRTICFYVSDYGYGHASRDIAIIRRIKEHDSGIKVYVKVDNSFEFMKRSLPYPGVEVIRHKNDVGAEAQAGKFEADKEKTLLRLREWLGKWEEFLRQEQEFCKQNKVSLILSDIPPQPFILARKLGIPGIAISNFDWHWVYRNLFGDISAIQEISAAYNQAALALVLPLNLDMVPFHNKRKIGLVSRKITRSKKEIRGECGVSEDDLLVYLGLGQSLSSDLLKVKSPRPLGEKLKVLVSSHVNLPGTFKVPQQETEVQNYIAACDLVVSKAGYGTLSEAISAEIPMLLFQNFIEGEPLVREIENLGIGEEISVDSFRQGEWVDRIGSLPKYKEQYQNLPERFRREGTEDLWREIANIGKG